MSIPQMPRTFEGLVTEHHGHYPSFRMEGAKQWFKMPMPYEGKRPPVGSRIRCTVASDGSVISIGVGAAPRSLRSRLIESRKDR